MDSIQIGNLAYLLLLGSVIGFWFFVQNRNSLGKTLQQAMAWALIFIGVIAAVGLWGDIRQTVMPRQTVIAEAGRIELPRAPDGHYYLTAEVNGAPIRFVVDTGASGIVLTRSDAELVGIDPNNLIFTGRANTANGTVSTAPVRLERMAVGAIEDRDLRAWVNNSTMDISLLGMTYLQRYSAIEIKNGALILTR